MSVLIFLNYSLFRRQINLESISTIHSTLCLAELVLHTFLTRIYEASLVS